ncbi:MAG: RNA methyltransferase [Pyrobaculum sp.]
MTLCRIELGARFPCLSLEEAYALAEMGGCQEVEIRGQHAVFKCPSCEIFKRSALAKSINGERIRKEKPQIARSVKTLDYITARTMVNLARVVRGSWVWEPFVGTGAVAYEVERVGGYVVGGDVDLKALDLARKNTSGDLVVADVLYPPLAKKFDAIVGDPPYGRLSKTEREVRALLREFIETALSLVKSGGFIVFASPIYVDFPYLKSCTMYLHGGLYRVIYIVQA